MTHFKRKNDVSKIAKNSVIFLLAATLLLFTCACGNTSPSNTPTPTSEPQTFSQVPLPESQSSEAPVVSTAPESTAQSGTSGEVAFAFKSYELVPQVTSIGVTSVLVIAELENTGDVPFITNDISFDLKDADGALLKNAKLINVYPGILNPGEVGYICGSVYSSAIDTGFAVDAIANVGPVGKMLAHAPRQKIDVEITDAALGEKMTFPNFVCHVTNTGTEKLSLLTVACPVFSSEGKLLTVIYNIIPSLEPGETVSVDQMALEYRLDGDYSTATIEPFAFVQELF